MPVSEAQIAQPVSAATLVPILRRAGLIALKTFRGQVRSWTKAGHSPVSEADHAVNDFLKDELFALMPQAAWLSEESVDDAARLDAGHVWVIDPIDGTRAYLAGLDDWSISVALVADGRPVHAALYAPVTDEMFFASSGQGATRNGKPLRVTDGASLEGARFGGPRNRIDAIAATVPGLVPMPKIHSLALRFARVADGSLDAVVAGPNSHDWDLAAADLLVEEAGGMVSDVSGRPVAYNRETPQHPSLIAAGPERLVLLRSALRARPGVL